MTIPNTFFLFLGLGLEIAWLWRGAHGQTNAEALQALIRFYRSRPVSARWISGGALLGLAVLLFLLRGVTLDIDHPLFTMVFGLMGAYVFFFGVFLDDLLPPVNEGAILTTQLTIALGLVAAEAPVSLPALLFLAVIPALVMAYLVFKNVPLSPVMKALVYFWYLLSLVMLTYQSGDVAIFELADWTVFDAFAAGTVAIFLLLHGLFTIRFFLIVSSLLVPANRPLINKIIPRLFSDEQVDARRFCIIMAIISVVIGLNYGLTLVSMPLLVSLIVVVATQALYVSEVETYRELQRWWKNFRQVAGKVREIIGAGR